MRNTPKNELRNVCIKAKALIQPKKRIPFPKRKKQFVKDYSSQKLINTSEEKFEHSPGLKAWAGIQNLKIAASSYSETGSIAEQYQSNHIYHVRYQKSKNPDAYLRSHETELLLHDGAENMLKRLGINPKTLDIEKLHNEYNSLYSKKETLQKTYKSAEKEINAFNRKLDNLNQYLNRTSQVQQINDRKTEKDQTTL